MNPNPDKLTCQLYIIFKNFPDDFIVCPCLTASALDKISHMHNKVYQRLHRLKKQKS